MTSIQRLLIGLAAALAVTCGIALATSAAFFPLSARRVDIAAGRDAFQSRCASCHSLTANSVALGPSLHEIGRVAASRVPGVSPERYIFDSIIDPAAFRAPGTTGEMPAGIADHLSAEQLTNVVAFLCTQGGRVEYRAVMALPAPPAVNKSQSLATLDLASVERGKELFFGKAQCSSCHWLDGTAGAALRAPSLVNVGNHSREALRQSLLDPSRHIAPAYVESSAVYEGNTVRGYRLPSGADQVKLLGVDAQGRLVVHSFAMSELEPFGKEGNVVKTSETSPMPVYKATEAPADIEALLDFLQTIR